MEGATTLQLYLPNAKVYSKGNIHIMDMALKDGHWNQCSHLSEKEQDDYLILYDALLSPGFLDVHVHLREPGFSYKERIATGTLAAARGGYVAVCTMPNLNPTPDTVEHVEMQQAIIDRDAVIPVYPYGCITMGQKGAGTLCDYKALRNITIAFSDDGRGVQSDDTMREAMRRIKEVDGLLVAHCEDDTLVKAGGCIHEGEFAKNNGFVGISSASEWSQIERDLKLSKETGCKYHICHVSTKESVALIRAAKADGVNVTCETAPHYLVMSDADLKDEGRFKMNPPIRGKEDQLALIEGLKDGTIDIIATDHAPHSAEEKAKGLKDSAMGIVGLETAFQVLYTDLVLKGIVSLETILKALIDNPRERFGFEMADVLDENNNTSSVFTLKEETIINPDDFLTLGRATPFEGKKVIGQCECTLIGGKVVWKR